MRKLEIDTTRVWLLQFYMVSKNEWDHQNQSSSLDNNTHIHGMIHKKEIGTLNISIKLHLGLTVNLDQTKNHRHILHLFS